MEGKVKIDLDPAQEEVAFASPEVRQLVVAGPGTGKTHTLIRRLKFLVEDGGLDPGGELLVLSFSRSAISEILSRLHDLAADRQSRLSFSRLNIRTFDSFATRLMHGTGETDPSGFSYDARIQLGIRLIRDKESVASKRLTSIRHLIVDEIQDLVGVRALLTRTVLERIGGGFTLLGDPAQAIFNWQLEDDPRGITSDEFLGWVREEYTDRGLIETTFSENHRVATQAADAAASVRGYALGDHRGHKDTDVLVELRKTIGRLDSAGSVAEPGPELTGDVQERTAVLCRTNAETRLVGSRLLEEGSTIVHLGRSDDWLLPAWIGRVLGTHTESEIDSSQFLELWDRAIQDGSQDDALEHWAQLEALGARRRRRISMRQLRHRMRMSGEQLRDSVDEDQEPLVTLSTIHKAKGREYDRVVVLAPEVNSKPSDVLEEARILYVAATRARSDLLRLERHGLPPVRAGSLQGGAERLIAGGLGTGVMLEFTGPKDVDPTSYVSRRVIRRQDHCRRAQNYIWTSIKQGTRLYLYPGPSGSMAERHLICARHPDSGKMLPIGMVSRDMEASLIDARTTKLKRREYGHSKSDTDLVLGTIVVSEVGTVILPEDAENLHAPYSTSRMCLGVIASGLISI